MSEEGTLTLRGRIHAEKTRGTEATSSGHTFSADGRVQYQQDNGESQADKENTEVYFIVTDDNNLRNDQKSDGGDYAHDYRCRSCGSWVARGIAVAWISAGITRMLRFSAVAISCRTKSPVSSNRRWPVEVSRQPSCIGDQRPQG
jgi:hypothetical protein